MTVTPDDGNGIVALPLHVCRVDILRHLVHLKDLSAINFVNATGTSAFDAKLVWVDRLPHLTLLSTGCRTVIGVLVFLNEHLALHWVILGLHFGVERVSAYFSDFGIDLTRDVLVHLHNRDFFRER